jgi:hypothetical protein
VKDVKRFFEDLSRDVENDEIKKMNDIKIFDKSDE